MVFVVFPLLLGFFILGALAWDAGVWYFDHRTAQNQVDAASLAAVQELPSNDTTAAVNVAKDWLKRNGVATSVADAIQVQQHNEADITAYCTQPQLSPGEARIVFGAHADDGYHRVRVCVRRESLVLFSGLAGVTDAVVSAGATANLTEQPVRYALMAMDPEGCDNLRLSGNNSEPPLTVNIGGDGSSYTHSTTCTGNNNGALRASGGAELIANCTEPEPGIESCGVHEHRSQWQETGGADISPEPIFRSSPMPDPFLDIVQQGLLPTPGACGDESQNPLPPGTYCNDPGGPLGPNETLILSGGTYVFTGGVSLSSKQAILTEGPSLIYITCDSPPCNPSENFSVNSDPDSGISVCVHGLIDGPADSEDECPFDGGTYDAEDVTCAPSEMECLAIVVDPDWGTGDCLTLSGQGSFQIFGNIYAISCTVTMSGGSTQTNQLNTTIVAHEIDFTGQSIYDVNWNSSTAPKDLVIALVE